MALPNDSLTVTPGSGATLATHLVGGKEYQLMIEADHIGHMKGSRDGYLIYFTPATNAVARRVGDLFNADSSAIVRVQGIWLIPTLTAITGANIQYSLKLTTAAGTGGTTETARKLDQSASNLSASITARSGATGGATESFKWFDIFSFNEETNAGAVLLAYQNQLPMLGDKIVEIVLRQNQGLLIKQEAGATVGLTGALLYFTVD